MIALSKNTGGLRPIAVGYVWRRLGPKCANKYAVARLSSHFDTLQLGIGLRGGGPRVDVPVCQRDAQQSSFGETIFHQRFQYPET